MNVHGKEANYDSGQPIEQQPQVPQQGDVAGRKFTRADKRKAVQLNPADLQKSMKSIQAEEAANQKVQRSFKKTKPTKAKT